MPTKIINAMLAKGWGYSTIALRAKIDESRLRTGTLGRREYDRLMHVAEIEARIDIDAVYLEGEE